MLPIPTLADLILQYRSYVQSEFNISIPNDRASVINTLILADAALLKSLYLWAAQIQQNIWYDTADYETTVRYGFVIIGRYPFNAVAGRYALNISGTVGTFIPAGTSWQSEQGFVYLIDGTYTLTGTDDVITIFCTQGGTKYELSGGDVLSVTAPLLGLNTNGTVDRVLLAPVEAETLTDYKQAIKDKIQLNPASWNEAAYKIIGNGIAGIRSVYTYRVNGSGGDLNIFLESETYGADVSVDTINEYVDTVSVPKPMGVFEVYTYTCPIKAIIIDIAMGVFPAFTVAEKSAISASLSNLCNTVRPFLPAIDTLASRNDMLAIYNIVSAINAAVPGKGFSSVSFTVAGVSETNYLFDNGEIPFLTNVTYS